jgi:hypothetical protein
MVLTGFVGEEANCAGVSNADDLTEKPSLRSGRERGVNRKADSLVVNRGEREASCRLLFFGGNPSCWLVHIFAVSEPNSC